MSDTLRRLAPDLSIRSDGRTIYGRVMPYGVETTVNDGFGAYVEVFRHGAFAKTIRERGDRIKLIVNHDKFGSLPIGVSTGFTETRQGLDGEFRVSETTAGNDALTLVRDGAADSFSVGFIPVIPGPSDPVPRSGIVERTEAKLLEVSVVAFPAYEDARIAGVRFDLDEILGELTPEEQEVARRLDLPALIRSAAQQHAADTPDEEAQEGPSDEAVERAADDEPSTEAADSTSDGHSRPHQPAQRPTLTRERLQEDLRRVTQMVAAASARSA
jgi:HK97 family phage prohead protease